MKDSAKYLAVTSIAFVYFGVLAALTIAVGIQVQVRSDGSSRGMLLLSCLSFGTAIFALFTLWSILFRKRWAMRSCGIFVLMWTVSVIVSDANAVVLSLSEPERATRLAITIAAPVLLALGLVHFVLLLGRDKDGPRGMP